MGVSVLLRTKRATKRASIRRKERGGMDLIDQTLEIG